MPGFVTNSQVTCDRCGGRGSVIARKCSKCNGEKILKEMNKLEIELERGTKEGEELVFEGESDEGPDYDAGDVLIRVR